MLGFDLAGYLKRIDGRNHVMRIFLGGTCNGSRWRDHLTQMLDSYDWFNPVVKDWTPECQQEELRQRELAEYVVYTITPRMMGVYSIAEVVDDSNKRPERTILCILQHDEDDDGRTAYLSGPLTKSLEATADLVKRNGGRVFRTLDDLANYLNEELPKSKGRYIES